MSGPDQRGKALVKSWDQLAHRAAQALRDKLAQLRRLPAQLGLSVQPALPVKLAQRQQSPDLQALPARLGRLAQRQR